MKKLFTTSVGRLRLIGFLEGISLILLVFVAVPFKYLLHIPEGTRLLGPVHGVLFTGYVFTVLSVSTEQNWSFRRQTAKVLLACLIPFGTFYLERTLFRKLADAD